MTEQATRDVPARRLRAPALRGLGLAALFAVASAAIAEEAHVVAPGSLVRWSGSGITECEQAGETFPPRGDACWIAVDLEATGSISVARTTAAGRESRHLTVGKYPFPTESLTGVDDKYVSPGKSALDRIARERRESGHAFARRTPYLDGPPFSPPLVEMPQGGRFGARRIFNGEPRSPHGGTDYRAAAGTPVFAPADGVVALSADHYFAGQSVYLDHGDGLISMAFHLSRRLVADGDRVKRGQKIGEVGATGRVTGPHLHFAVRWRGARIDPTLLFEVPSKLATIP
ncbi:MAG: M23 family metallopeptidase [Thermoanaerobaculia bacterium]